MSPCQKQTQIFIPPIFSSCWSRPFYISNFDYSISQKSCNIKVLRHCVTKIKGLENQIFRQNKSGNFVFQRIKFISDILEATKNRPRPISEPKNTNHHLIASNLYRFRCGDHVYVMWINAFSFKSLDLRKLNPLTYLYQNIIIDFCGIIKTFITI